MRKTSKTRLNRIPAATKANGFAAQRRKAVPHEFVLDAIASVSPRTRSMFGCLAVYVEDKIVLALRDKPDHPADNGVWLATSPEHHEALGREFRLMRSIQVFGKPVSSWQVLPSDSANFEEDALRACELILAGDTRIGKVPGERRPSRGQRATHQDSPAGARKTGKAAKRASKK
jgi:hypothetical protein